MYIQCTALIALPYPFRFLVDIYLLSCVFFYSLLKIKKKIRRLQEDSKAVSSSHVENQTPNVKMREWTNMQH